MNKVVNICLAILALLLGVCPVSAVNEAFTGTAMLRIAEGVIAGHKVYPFVTTSERSAYPNSVAGDGGLSFSYISSASAFVFGKGFDHADIVMNGADYSFTWDGSFPGTSAAPKGWYYITIESIDVNGNKSSFTTKIWTGGPAVTPTPAPDYEIISFTGILNEMDQQEAVVNGIKYHLAASSRIQADLTNGDRVIGTALNSLTKDLLVISEMTRVDEQMIPFSGLINDLDEDYAIIDGMTYEIDQYTQWYCDDTRIGDSVSGVAMGDDLGTVRIKEFGPVSCNRIDAERQDSGIVN